MGGVLGGGFGTGSPQVAGNGMRLPAQPADRTGGTGREEAPAAAGASSSVVMPELDQRQVAPSICPLRMRGEATRELVDAGSASR